MSSYHQIVKVVSGCIWGGLFLVALSGCATNPVTGKSELSLVSEENELAIGRKQYRPSRQMQGGDFKLDPELTHYVQRVGQRLAAVSDRQLPYEFAVLNDSTPNAWALPGGKIAVNRGLLLELKNEAELAAVLGHEIVHAAARHGAQGIERGMLLQGVMLAAGVATRDSDYSQLAVGAASVGASLINQGYSRDAELEADYYGMSYMARAGYDPLAAVGLQETFVRLSKDRQQNWLSGLFASHPPSTERVEKNRQRAQELGKGGELGTARYREMIARLKKAAPAYKNYADGVAALGKKQPEQALSLANRAIAVEPREALFYGLKGDAFGQRGAYRKALAAYDEAVSRDDGFFRHYLKRGEVKVELGDRAGARQDLKRSLDLLPTADAHYLLGGLALREGDQQSAIAHYRQASGAAGEQGKAAAKALVRLDLPAHPQRYIKSRLGLDRTGVVLIYLENPTPVAADDVRVQLGEANAGGRITVRAQYRLPGILGAGKSVTLRSAIRLDDKRQLNRWSSRVVSAVVVE
ncbi:M48 family metalloprotease [Sedimenticola sp.]|uniref:M48 family metalloprotease n=1 Tax=Sedimenticola sp. TaxID=1940285 RepID=UPI003D0C4952